MPDIKKLTFNADAAEEYFSMMLTCYRDTANDIFRRDNEGRHASEQRYSAEYQKYLGMQIALREVLEYFGKYELGDCWISVEERLPEPEQIVLVSCKQNGRRYQCLAFYVPKKWLREQSHFNWDYEACDEYCEEADDYYVNEGWYERIYNWDDYSAVGIGDFVTHWMPLPEPPKGE